MTELWPPRIAALPPPSNAGYGATANLPLIFEPYMLPSA